MASDRPSTAVIIVIHVKQTCCEQPKGSTCGKKHFLPQPKGSIGGRKHFLPRPKNSRAAENFFYRTSRLNLVLIRVWVAGASPDVELTRYAHFIMASHSYAHFITASKRVKFAIMASTSSLTGIISLRNAPFW